MPNKTRINVALEIFQQRHRTALALPAFSESSHADINSGSDDFADEGCGGAVAASVVFGAACDGRQ